MADTFKSVKRFQLQRAFALAHHFSRFAEGSENRKYFQQIAKLIWESCGEPRPMPTELPEEMKLMVELGGRP